MVSDVDAVMAVIRGAARCTLCIARETGVAPFGVLSALARIGRGVTIIDAVLRCDGCLQVTGTHRV